MVDLVKHLRYFVVVAEELHFGNAALRLGMAQPPLSQRIKRLEEELGVRLFDRSRRQVRLTEPGRIAFGEAREILGRVERLRELVGRTAEERAVLRAGVPTDLGGPVIAALIASFHDAADDDVRLAPQELSTTAQAEMLADGALDVGVLRHPVDPHGLELGSMLTQPVGVLVPTDSDLAGAPAVHLADLAGRDLVLFPREAAPGLYDETVSICRRYGFAPPEIHETSATQFGLGLVLSGAAVALLPETELPGVTWRRLLGDPIGWNTSTAWRAGADSASVQRFRRIADAVFQEVAGMTTPAARTQAINVRPASGFLA